MDNKIITTPNGYTVTLKADLSYGEYEDIQNLMVDSMQIDPLTGKYNGPKKLDRERVRNKIY